LSPEAVEPGQQPDRVRAWWPIEPLEHQPRHARRRRAAGPPHGNGLPD
jgi:hypothetical protein